MYPLTKLILKLFTVWPANLVLCALFNTLHSQQYVGMGSRGGVSRERFFTFALVIATVYCKFFIPPLSQNFTRDGMSLTKPDRMLWCSGRPDESSTQKLI